MLDNDSVIPPANICGRPEIIAVPVQLTPPDLTSLVHTIYHQIL